MATKKKQTSKISLKPVTACLAVVILIFLGAFILYKSHAPSVTEKVTPAPEIPNNWKAYSIPGVLSFKYPPAYFTFDSSQLNSPGVNVYDKKEHLGPANTYLSISASQSGQSDYDTVYKDYKDVVRNNITTENLPDGFKITYKDNTGYVFQVDRFYKLKNGYARAYYRSSPGIPSDVYDKIISSIKILY